MVVVMVALLVGILESLVVVVQAEVLHSTHLATVASQCECIVLHIIVVHATGILHRVTILRIAVRRVRMQRLASSHGAVHSVHGVNVVGQQPALCHLLELLVHGILEVILLVALIAAISLVHLGVITGSISTSVLAIHRRLRRIAVHAAPLHLVVQHEVDALPRIRGDSVQAHLLPLDGDALGQVAGLPGERAEKPGGCFALTITTQRQTPALCKKKSSLLGYVDGSLADHLVAQFELDVVGRVQQAVLRRGNGHNKHHFNTELLYTRSNNGPKCAIIYLVLVNDPYVLGVGERAHKVVSSEHSGNAS